MRQISELFHNIDGIRRNIDSLNRDLAKNEKALREHTERVVELVCAGKSTEDRLLDMVIRTYRHMGDGIVERCRTLEEQMKGKSGELVAYCFKCRSERSASADIDVAILRLGVLEGDTLVWHEGKEGLYSPSILLPVPRYIQFFDGFFFAQRRRGRGFIAPPVFEENITTSTGMNIVTPLWNDYLARGEAVELTVGDEDIRRLMSGKGVGRRDVSRYVSMLGKSL